MYGFGKVFIYSSIHELFTIHGHDMGSQGNDGEKMGSSISVNVPIMSFFAAPLPFNLSQLFEPKIGLNCLLGEVCYSVKSWLYFKLGFIGKNSSLRK